MNPYVEIRLPRTNEYLRGYIIGKFDPDKPFLFEDEETLTTYRLNPVEVDFLEIEKGY